MLVGEELACLDWLGSEVDLFLDLVALPSRGNSRSFRFALELASGMDEDDSDWLAENENPLKISG